jgi:hypothetical protein
MLYIRYFIIVNGQNIKTMGSGKFHIFLSQNEDFTRGWTPDTTT